MCHEEWATLFFSLLLLSLLLRVQKNPSRSHKSPSRGRMQRSAGGGGGRAGSGDDKKAPEEKRAMDEKKTGGAAHDSAECTLTPDERAQAIMDIFAQYGDELANLAANAPSDEVFFQMCDLIKQEMEKLVKTLQAEFGGSLDEGLVDAVIGQAQRVGQKSARTPRNKQRNGNSSSSNSNRGVTSVHSILDRERRWKVAVAAGAPAGAAETTAKKSSSRLE